METCFDVSDNLQYEIAVHIHLTEIFCNHAWTASTVIATTDVINYILNLSSNMILINHVNCFDTCLKGLGNKKSLFSS